MILSACIQTKNLLFPWREELVAFLSNNGLLRGEVPEAVEIDEAEEFHYGAQEWRGIVNEFADSGALIRATPYPETMKALDLLVAYQVAPMLQVDGIPPRAVSEMLQWFRVHGLDKYSTLVGPADFINTVVLITTSEDDAFCFSEINKYRGLGMSLVAQKPEHVLKIVEKVIVEPVEITKSETAEENEEDSEEEYDM